MERTIRAVRWPLYGAFVLASLVSTMLALPIGLAALGLEPNDVTFLPLSITFVVIVSGWLMLTRYGAGA